VIGETATVSLGGIEANIRQEIERRMCLNPHSAPTFEKRIALPVWAEVSSPQLWSGSRGALRKLSKVGGASDGD
jgi:hypothetical protein